MVGLKASGPRDAVAAFVDSRALGRLERRVRLGGRLPVAGSVSPKAVLCLTSRGLWLVGAVDALRGEVIPLLDHEDLEIETGRLRAQLRVGPHRIPIPPHRREQAFTLLAVGRLRGAGGRASAQTPRGRHVESPDEVERTWLAGFVGPEESLLAWLRTATPTRVPSRILPDAAARFSLVMTDRRLVVAGISVVGDVLVETLDVASLETSRAPEGFMLRQGSRQLSSQRRNADLFAEVCQVATLPAEERLVEIARLNWLDRRSVGLAPCRSLLATAVQRGSQPAHIATFLVSHALEEPAATEPGLGGTLQWLRAEERPPRTLAGLWAEWDVKAAAGLALVGALRVGDENAEPWALALHRAIHARQREQRRSVPAATNADLDLADHLIAAGEITQAVALLEERLAALPREAVEALRAPADVQPVSGADIRDLRSRVYQLLAVAKATPEGPDLDALEQLARLHPLAPAHVRALAERATGDLRDRAQQVVELLDPGGLGPSPGWESITPEPLSETLLTEVLRHPVTREDSPLLSKLQTLLAMVPVPDYSVLRDYCEHLTPQRQSYAVDALQDASVLLGVSGVEAYVSRGLKGVGLRAYEGKPPFILMGGQHLDPATPYYLPARELRFAVGAELAHLRYGHHRVTANEVWSGAMSKGKEGLGLAIGMLPVLKGWWLADRLASATSRIPSKTVKRVLNAAEELNERVTESLPTTPSSGNRDAISALNEEFVMAHRVMQLTADRAGLVMARSLPAAVRAMLLVRRDYQDELETVQKEGLARVLGRRAEDGHFAYLDLAIRVAALVSFYLSPDYARLTLGSEH